MLEKVDENSIKVASLSINRKDKDWKIYMSTIREYMLGEDIDDEIISEEEAIQILLDHGYEKEMLYKDPLPDIIY